jgi:hypothetical protein
MKTIEVTAHVGIDPSFRGSIHDDLSAQTFGYQGALVPGPLVYGYLSRLAVDQWGQAWLERGTMSSRNRRPTYDGQVLTITADDPVTIDGGIRVALIARDTAGNEVATGEATLPDHAPPAPDLAAYVVTPFVQPAPVVAVGGMQNGAPLRSTPGVFTTADLAASLSDFGETWPGYAAGGILHAGHLMRRAVRDGVRSFSCPTPGIFVSGWAQHLALARAGDTLATAGRVLGSYERKGSHYYDSEQVVIANGHTVVALIRRTSIYAVRKALAA